MLKKEDADGDDEVGVEDEDGAEVESMNCVVKNNFYVWTVWTKYVCKKKRDLFCCFVVLLLYGYHVGIVASID